jgi:hypothetical protein
MGKATPVMRILRGGGINFTRKRGPMTEPQENIYDKIRRVANEKREQERERRARLAELMREGGTPEWKQNLLRRN